MAAAQRTERTPETQPLRFSRATRPTRFFWRTVLRTAAAVSGALALASAASGCIPRAEPPGGGPGTSTVAPNGGAGGEGGVGGSGGAEPKCDEGEIRDCHITLGEHNGILSCFTGIEVCADGAWGPCSGGSPAAPAPPPKLGETGKGITFVPRALPPPLGHVPPSLGPAAPCVNNPCDPSCQIFEEQPGTPIESPPQVLIAQWQSGSYADVPPTTQIKGTKEPCVQAFDCQFDQYCSNPISGSCSHHKCVEGKGLQPSCDPCVQGICLTDPSCCAPTIAQMSCSHNVCVEGAALVSKCDDATPADAVKACVETICTTAGYAYCCSTAGANARWDQGCIEQVDLKCKPAFGQSCTTSSDAWDKDCIEMVSTLCGAFCMEDDPADGACDHHKCYVGKKLNSGCDPCVTQVCATDSYCCNTAWDGLCLEEVKTICGETCPAKGDCVSWLPNEKDEDCTPYDLTVGVVCTKAGVPTVPVCNHGNTVSPPNLPLVALPPGANQIPGLNPSFVGATSVNVPAVPVGKCVEVPFAGLADGSELVVNPNGFAGTNGSECHTANNWSVYSAAVGACATPKCSGTSGFTKVKKINLFMAVDQSSSNTCSPTAACPTTATPSRWDLLKSGLTSFFQNDASAGIGVWLRFWPYTSPIACPSTSTAVCGSYGCSVPNVPLGTLAVGVDAQETALISAFPVTPNGSNTPFYPALEGAIDAAVAHQIANPNETDVVIMVTDGEPNYVCVGSPLSTAGNEGYFASLASTAFSGYGVRTYIIGILDLGTDAKSDMNIIAGSGGGKFIFLNDVGAQLLSTLNTIKNDIVACSFDLPSEQIFDPATATVTFTPTVGASSTLTQVADASACGAGGWYYDDPVTPTKIVLCPTSCNSVNAVTGTFEIGLECVSQHAPFTATEVYESTCPVGQSPQWGFLAYDTDVPGDSLVKFSVATSDGPVAFGAPLLAGTATNATPDCAMGGPSPCPIDLYNALGGLPAAHRKYLELTMDVIPTSDANFTPQINSWQVTYSCIDTE